MSDHISRYGCCHRRFIAKEVSIFQAFFPAVQLAVLHRGVLRCQHLFPKKELYLQKICLNIQQSAFVEILAI